MRTFTAIVAGQNYDIPTSMGVLNEAEQVSGINVLEALADGKLGYLIQGVIYAGLKRQGVKAIALLRDVPEDWQTSLDEDGLAVLASRVGADISRAKDADARAAAIAAAPITYEMIGEVSDFFEAKNNVFAFSHAMAPDTPSSTERGESKNEPKEDPKS